MDASGNVLFSSGDPDRPVFYRSSIKPFQALAAARTGRTLPDEHLAVSCASHGGFPVHVGIVEAILADHGLSVDDLLQVARGNTRKERRFHNCSGKHAGWLAACTVAGWDTKTYLEPDHPLQRSIVDIMGDVSGIEPEPVGVDGCGAPTLRGSTKGLANAFIRLGNDPELAPIASAVNRFGALVADNLRPEGRTALWWGGPLKVGAEGLLGMTTGDVTIASKSHSGRSEIAVAAALVTAEKIGALSRAMVNALGDEIRPPVVGGGAVVGHMELIEA
jgi:L-asparaginase II